MGGRYGLSASAPFSGYGNGTWARSSGHRDAGRSRGDRRARREKAGAHSRKRRLESTIRSAAEVPDALNAYCKYQKAYPRSSELGDLKTGLEAEVSRVFVAVAAGMGAGKCVARFKTFVEQARSVFPELNYYLYAIGREGSVEYGTLDKAEEESKLAILWLDHVGKTVPALNQLAQHVRQYGDGKHKGFLVRDLRENVCGGVGQVVAHLKKGGFINTDHRTYLEHAAEFYGCDSEIMALLAEAHQLEAARLEGAREAARRERRASLAPYGSAGRRGASGVSSTVSYCPVPPEPALARESRVERIQRLFARPAGPVQQVDPDPSAWKHNQYLAEQAADILEESRLRGYAEGTDAW